MAFVTYVPREPLQCQRAHEKEIPTLTPLIGSLPLSPQWHTLGDCASLSASHTTFSTQCCQPSNSICLPLSLAALICMREMSRGLPSVTKRKISLHLACDASQTRSAPSTRKHDIIYFLYLHLGFQHLMSIWRWTTDTFDVFDVSQLHLKPLCCLTMDWSVTVGDKQLLPPVTLNQGDMSLKNSSSCTWQDAQVATRPHPAAWPLIKLSPLSLFPSFPLSLFLLPLFPHSGLCTSLHSLEQSGAAGCYASRQPWVGKGNV